ncbi:MAG: alginate lyase family protein, partial [Planctomycetota bacterium]|nr:alginate lyase family protein [Planctomycetota bacterium]
LGQPARWNVDFKTDKVWPNSYSPWIEYSDLESPCDVKIPWEISRFQWTLPAAQAFCLTGEECYAEAVRDLLLDWIETNPYAWSINWACTMDVALRAIVWAALFHAFEQSRAWAEPRFRERFLVSLYLHGDYIRRHIESADINGNHYTANAAGLVVAGLFFGTGKKPLRWSELGWQMLSEELPRQILADGVDFEASVPYHRLVTELFLFPALYRKILGLEVPSCYQERIIQSARFTAGYSRPDGSTPLWGDADDARVLPMGGQPINDHRYMIGLIGSAFEDSDLVTEFSGPREEIYWILGLSAARTLPEKKSPTPFSTPLSFPEGGLYILRSDRDHVFIDCGPIGQRGQGGHGHNDCLSFSAHLDGSPLITDCGAYLYTASRTWRNRFRSTSFHNTPQVDGEEVNRFIGPNFLWTLHDDATPEVLRWESNEQRQVFTGRHLGYERLNPAVIPTRTILLDPRNHRLLIEDRFEGSGSHEVAVPYHLDPTIEISGQSAGRLELSAEHGEFILLWDDPDAWTLTISSGWVSPSYGIRQSCCRLELLKKGPLEPLRVAFLPKNALPGLPREWLLKQFPLLETKSTK